MYSKISAQNVLKHTSIELLFITPYVYLFQTDINIFATEKIIAIIYKE